MYRLMIKEHNVTKLKYLCITKRKDWKNYTGSGIKWLKHIKEHGNNICTTLLFESQDYEEFLENCVYYSIFYDVVENPDFANLVPEFGYNNKNNKSNLELWWEYATEELKRSVYLKRSEGMKKRWETYKIPESTKQKLSKAAIEQWDLCTAKQRKDIIQNLHNGLQNFLSNADTEAYKEWIRKKSINTKRYFENIDKNIISERNRKQRLELSQEKKEARKKKILANHATGKYNHIWERYSKERIGVNNPASKIVLWLGVQMTKGEFDKLKIPLKIQEKMFNHNENCKKMYTENNFVYEKQICPHCGFENNKTRKQSGFKRWHMDNCKERK